MVHARFQIPPYPDQALYNPGGLAVIWAEENSRDALFEAMQRREAYGTSGPRMIVRFFGGWDYPDSLCEGEDFVAQGYAAGVPMGGELSTRGDAIAPRFAVSALRDPGGGGPSTPLQRIQIIKSWVEGGVGHERVYDVAGGASEAAVDLATCQATPESRGHDRLCRIWQDPDFDPAAPAAYYARVVENPSCRWSQYVCNAHAVDCDSGAPSELAACCDPDVPRVIQERAWTSPIWYTPQGGTAK